MVYPIIYSWLVVAVNPSEKYDFVSWEDDLPDIWKVIIQPCSTPATSNRVSTKVMQETSLAHPLGRSESPQSWLRPRFGAVCSPSLWFPIGPSQWEKPKSSLQVIYGGFLKSKATPSSESESPISRQNPSHRLSPTCDKGPAAISTPVCMFLVLTLMGKRPTFGGTPVGSPEFDREMFWVKENSSNSNWSWSNMVTYGKIW